MIPGKHKPQQVCGLSVEYAINLGNTVRFTCRYHAVMMMQFSQKFNEQIEIMEHFKKRDRGFCRVSERLSQRDKNEIDREFVAARSRIRK